MSPIAAPAPGALLDDTSVAWATAARWWAVLGGQRALLLQVAHPEVAAAVAEHSDWEARSLHRLVSTLTAMLRLSFGSASAAHAQAESLGRVHGSIVGRTADDVVGYDVTLERTTQPSPTPLTCKGNDGVSYPVYRLVNLTESGETDAADRPAREGSTAPTG